MKLATDQHVLDYGDLDMHEAQLLGTGAFGTVHVTRWSKTPVAVKTANDQITEFQKMLFMRELDTLARVRHPNIVQVGPIPNRSSHAQG